MEINIKLSLEPHVIKEELDKLQGLFKEKQVELKIISSAISYYQSICKHNFEKTGFNERDGKWSTPCTICGYSY